MFHVPERHRLTVGPWGSPPDSGNNGAFMVPCHSVDLRIIASDGAGWEHVSASLALRCPTWAEMCFLKGLFWDPEDAVIQIHPPESDYVNEHPFCLHLWRPMEAALPLPPSILVGPRSRKTLQAG